MVPEANALLAPHSFAQLADDAFSEDLYEAGLHVVDDIASQGFYPDSSLVRHVAAIALVSTCPPQRSRDKTNRSNLARPSNEAVLASTAILARLARLLDVDVVLDAFPPCSRAAVRGDMSSSTSTSTKGRRSSGEGSEEDSAGMSSRTKTLADEYGAKDDVWEVLRVEELGNIKVHGNSSSKSRTREGEQASARSRSKKRVHKEGHEEEEKEAGSSAYDREAVWRVLDVLVHCWRGQRTRVEAGERSSRPSLHLARQFPKPRSSAIGKRRRKLDGHEGEDDEGKEEKMAVASTEVGEAIDVVVTGLMPRWTREREQKTRLSRKAKHAERHRRAKTATRLLIELLHLGRLGLLDKDALVRRMAMILDEADDMAIDVILDEMLAETDAVVENALMRAITLYLLQTVNVKTQTADIRSIEMLPGLTVDDNDSESISLLSRLVLASPTPVTIEKFIAPDVAQAKKSPYDELQKELDVMRDTWTLSTDEAPRKRRWAFSKVSSFSSSAGRVSSNSSSSSGGGGGGGSSSGGTASALGSSQTRADLPSKTQRSACVEALALTAATRLAELQARLRAIRFVLVIVDVVRRSSASMGDGLDLDLEGFVDALKTLRDKVVETKISMEGIGKEKIEKLVASFVVGKPRHIAAENYRDLFEDALMGFERGISTLQGWVDVGELWTGGGMDDED